MMAVHVLVLVLEAIDVRLSSSRLSHHPFHNVYKYVWGEELMVTKSKTLRILREQEQRKSYQMSLHHSQLEIFRI
ncbi:hypothetical protein NDU88_008817 [Pleurodeles waltl]|uniref:Secreted protein n=1 Tax=Pleurodeles waltl TaxID=8319 RepID=A0AAV7RWU3_PLEWA|nr:hypothetical protein NDU88_008817 [Pleurodeles waltl]